MDINDPRGGYRVGGYREWPVPPRLRVVVDAVWSFVAEGSGRPRSHRIVPETGVSVCVTSVPMGDGGTSMLTLMGPIGAPRVFEPPPGLRMAGVRLKPEWCRDLLDVEPADHLDRWVDMQPGHGHPLVGLVGHVAAGGRSDRRALLAAVGRLWEWRTVSPEARLAHRALETIRRQPALPLDGRRRAELLGVSSRHVRRVVTCTAGVGLKRFHRIRRFHHAVSAASASGAVEWSRIAFHAGCFDQAHLIREFSSLAGATPAVLREERLALGRE